MGEGASRRPAFRPEGPAADPRGGHPQARPPETAVRIKSFRSPRAMPFRSLRGRALAPSVERTAPARGAQGLLARFDGRRSPLPPAIGRPRLRHAQALRRRWRPAPSAVARAESAPSAAPLHCGPTAGPQQPWTIRVRFRRIEPYLGSPGNPTAENPPARKGPRWKAYECDRGAKHRHRYRRVPLAGWVRNSLRKLEIGMTQANARSGRLRGLERLRQKLRNSDSGVRTPRGTTSR